MNLRKLAQVAMEYLIIIGFVAVITIPLFLVFQEQYSGTSTKISSSEINQISKRLIDAAEQVYYLGKPSKTTLNFHFPSGIDSVNISENEIVFVVRLGSGSTEIVFYSPVNISGELKTHQGTHQISIENKGGYIYISE